MPAQQKHRIKAIAEVVSVRPSASDAVGPTGLPLTHIVTFQTNDAVIDYYIEQPSATLLLAVESYRKPFHASGSAGTLSAEALKPSI